MQSGISLYLTIIIMTILLAIVLGLTTIFLSQVVMLREMGHSVVALYAADASIEKVLVDWTDPDLSPDYYSGVLGQATYQVFVTEGGSDGCAALNYCIKSIGTYKGVSRAIEITY